MGIPKLLFTVDAIQAVKVYCKYTDGRYEKEGLELVQKYLPYLNPATGLRNRMITRDPVTGLGELEEEYNPLNGCHLRRRTAPYRNPIIMEGELGKEYNCINTTTEKVPKPRLQRDPITLEGDLGQELDHLRPHGGLARHHKQDIPSRDPISGKGNFGNERDPSQKTDGMRTSKYSTRAQRTDPITHATSSNSVKTPSMRHYSNTWSYRDLIGYTDDDKMDIKKFHNKGLRHFPQNNGVTDPITHRYNTCSAIRSPYRRPQLIRNPITHEVREYGSGNMNGEIEQTNSFQNLQYQPNKSFRNARNPITGEGINREDCIDLLKLPNDYCFRKKLTSTAIEGKKSPIRKIEKQTTSAATSKSTSAPIGKPKTSEDQPVVKKVIRPKRSVAPVQDDPPKTNPESLDEEIKIGENGTIPAMSNPDERQAASKQKYEMSNPNIANDTNEKVDTTGIKDDTQNERAEVPPESSEDTATQN